MPFVDFGSVALRYRVDGDGSDPLVLIHEMGGSIESWDEVVPLLPRRFKILRFDMRGSGLSEKLRGPLGFATLSGDIVALLDHLGWVRPVAVAGCAVGGGVALDFAARYPERAAAVVAMPPAIGIDPKRREAILDLIDRWEHGEMRDFVELAVTGSFPPALGCDEAVYQNYRGRWLGNDPTSLAHQYRILVLDDLQGRLGDISCPVLLVGGTHDAARPPAQVARIAEGLATASFKEITSGHFMAAQAPEEVAALLVDFLAPVFQGA